MGCHFPSSLSWDRTPPVAYPEVSVSSLNSASWFGWTRMGVDVTSTLKHPKEPTHNTELPPRSAFNNYNLTGTKLCAFGWAAYISSWESAKTQKCSGCMNLICHTMWAFLWNGGRGMQRLNLDRWAGHVTCSACHKTCWLKPLNSKSNSAPLFVRSRESQIHQTKDAECDHTTREWQVGWKIPMR